MALPNGPVAIASEAESALFDFVDGYDRAYDRAAEAVSLTPAQACVLGHLDERRGMGTIAEDLGCDASNVTQLVVRLEGLGLVTRVPNPDDRRSRLVARTPEGERVNRRFEESFSFARSAVERLTPEEQDDLARLVRKALG